jgi:hypothetical protein
MSKKVFDLVKTFRQYPCVTIVLPTHRTAPDNKQDIIVLKNLITEVHNRLAEEFSKRDLTKLQANLDKIDTIDMEHNKEGLVIFVNDDVFTYDKLLFRPEVRVIIDETFATRDLIRAGFKAENYYVLTLGKDKARLFEGYLEYLTEVHGHGFPMENNTLYLTNSGQRSDGAREDAMLEEFFNRVDKTFLDIYKENPGDLILAGIERNATHYHNIADKKDIIIGSINMNGDAPKSHELAADAWPLMRSVIEKRQTEALSELEKAVSENKFESDIQLIYNAILEGRGHTLYAEQGYLQPVVMDSEGNITIVEDSKAPGVIDDIIDELAELTLQYGGKIVFLSDGSLEKYQRLALITRY